GRERSGDLADENREREIPRADADKDATTPIGELVALAGRARQALRLERVPRLNRIVAAEVDRLPPLRNPIAERPAAFALHQGDERTAALLHQIGGAFEHGGTLIDRRRLPSGKRRLRPVHRVVDSTLIRFRQWRGGRLPIPNLLQQSLQALLVAE